MARMYSRRKGKSGSTKPVIKESPSWLKGVKIDVNKIVLELTDAGKGPAEIGTILRDQHGIPDVKVFMGKSITDILKEEKKYPKIPHDMANLIKTAGKIRQHFDSNKQDMDAKRGLQLTEAKIRRLAKYYQREKVLPADWKYSPDKLRL